MKGSKLSRSLIYLNFFVNVLVILIFFTVIHKQKKRKKCRKKELKGRDWWTARDPYGWAQRWPALGMTNTACTGRQTDRPVFILCSSPYNRRVARGTSHEKTYASRWLSVTTALQSVLVQGVQRDIMWLYPKTCAGSLIRLNLCHSFISCF